ncbi:NUDIX hydrolase, partial [Candidatus Pacearchaeota archaeon]|nr:NUDIX hydrolase [Candidatus Pacearchaeota archaeon]
MEENLREYIEEGTDTIGGQYTGRGEQRYKEARVIMPRMTHDIFIHYKNGILLMVRVNEPAKGMLWCPGGSVEKFVSIQESLRRKVKEECGLDIKNIEFLGLV